MKGGGAIRLLFLFSYNYSMIEKRTVCQIVEEWLEGKDYFLVEVTVSPDDKIVVEIDHAEGVWIEDCVDLSRFIESKLNREEEDYELEVGSAGISLVMSGLLAGFVPAYRASKIKPIEALRAE